MMKPNLPRCFHDQVVFMLIKQNCTMTFNGHWNYSMRRMKMIYAMLWQLQQKCTIIEKSVISKWKQKYVG